MYSKTVAARSKTNSPPPRHLYVAPDILEKTWETLPVLRGGRLNNPWQKRVSNLSKASAAHVKEGLMYESRAVIWNNPLKPVEISGWGFLNNISGGSAETRDSKYGGAINDIVKRIDAHILSKFPPLAKNADKKNVAARNKKIRDYQTANPIWKYPSGDLTKRGHNYVKVLMKRSGYFIAPKFSTLELRDDPAVFSKGKGDNFIELDGLIHDVKSNKFIILELKKGYGKKGEEEAQQMRKAAALLRKWSYEITGTVPTVELYFAAGAATNYKNYEFNSEINGGAVQDYSASQIRRMISAKPNHLVYIRTPVNLLLGVGLANLLRIDPRRVRNIVNSLAGATRGWNAASNYLSKLRTSNNRVIPFLYLNEKAMRKTNAANAKKNTGPDLYFNVKGFAQSNPSFLKLVPPQWRPTKKNKPTDILARISEDILYIKGREAKLAKQNTPEIRADIVSHLQLLLSNKYKNYLNPTTREKLTAKLAQYGGEVVATAASPERTTKYYSRVLKAREVLPAKYFKREIGAYKKKTMGKSVKFGASKVRPEAILPEFEFGRKRPGYNIGNVTAENVAEMSTEEIMRKLGVLVKRALGPSNQANKNLAIRFAQHVVNTKRTNNSRLANFAQQQINKIKGPLGSIVRATPAPRAAAAPAAMNEAAAKSKILNAAKQQLSPNSYKRTFPRGTASVAKYVRETASGRSIANFAKNVNRPGSIRPR
jgi:hypothetical protein